MNRTRGSGYIRGECLVDGCTHPQEYKDMDDKGRRRYGKYCFVHKKVKNARSRNMLHLTEKKKINNDKCIRCGWVGPCDRHRLVPALGYAPDNVEVLCPNCHRLETLGNPLVFDEAVTMSDKQIKAAVKFSNICKHGMMKGLCKHGCV